MLNRFFLQLLLQNWIFDNKFPFSEHFESVFFKACLELINLHVIDFFFKLLHIDRF